MRTYTIQNLNSQSQSIELVWATCSETDPHIQTQTTSSRTYFPSQNQDAVRHTDIQSKGRESYISCLSQRLQTTPRRCLQDPSNIKCAGSLWVSSEENGASSLKYPTAPILTLGSTTFSHVKHENIYLVAITKSNANAALVFEFLYRLIALGKGYFGKFDEEAVKNNFVLVYELLDGQFDPFTSCRASLI